MLKTPAAPAALECDRCVDGFVLARVGVDDGEISECDHCDGGRLRCDYCSGLAVVEDQAHGRRCAACVAADDEDLRRTSRELVPFTMADLVDGRAS